MLHNILTKGSKFIYISCCPLGKVFHLVGQPISEATILSDFLLPGRLPTLLIIIASLPPYMTVGWLHW